MAKMIDLRERIATAANTADMSEERAALEVVAAMGLATMARDSAGGVRQTDVGTAVIHSGRRLGELMERAKYAADRRAERPAVLLFARWIASRRRWCDRARVNKKPAILYVFAGLVMAEWLRPYCPQCGGAGFIPLGVAGARNTLTTPCQVCKGRGMAKIDHVARATALGLRMEAYSAHWRDKFEEAHGWLGDIEGAYLRPLQSQLMRGTLQPVSENSVAA